MLQMDTDPACYSNTPAVAMRLALTPHLRQRTQDPLPHPLAQRQRAVLRRSHRGQPRWAQRDRARAAHPCRYHGVSGSASTATFRLQAFSVRLVCADHEADFSSAALSPADTSRFTNANVHTHSGTKLSAGSTALVIVLVALACLATGAGLALLGARARAASTARREKERAMESKQVKALLHALMSTDDEVGLRFSVSDCSKPKRRVPPLTGCMTC